MPNLDRASSSSSVALQNCRPKKVELNDPWPRAESAAQAKAICEDPGSLPRERLLRQGAGTLTDSELVAILLGTGTRGESVLAMATRLLAECGGLEGMRTAGTAEIQRPGVGPAKASRVLAAVELASRLAFRETPRRLSIDRPEAFARYLLLRYAKKDQEVMGAVYLNIRNEAVFESEVFRGTLRRASVEPRTILREALSVGAASVLLFHTHPSGNPSPSAEDLVFTERFQHAAEVVGIHLTDHLILGSTDRWTSLRRSGALASVARG